MAVTKIIDNVTLDGNWHSVSLGSDLHTFYLIGIKEAKAETDTINPEDITKIGFELGIECGIENKYLTIGRVTLNFGLNTSSDPALDKITAFERCMNYPSSFFIRPIEAYMKDGKILKEGTTSIDVNINAVSLI